MVVCSGRQARRDDSQFFGAREDLYERMLLMTSDVVLVIIYDVVAAL